MKQIKIYIVVLFLTLVSLKLWSQDITVSAKLDTNIMLIGDQTNIALQLIQPQDKKVYLPMLTDKIGEKIDMLSFTSPDTTTLPNGNLKISMKIRITSFDTGYLAIPPFEFRYNVMNDSVYSSVETHALLLAVVPLKVDMKKGIADIKPIIEEPFSYRELIPYFVGFFILAIIILIGIYVYVRIKNHKPIISLPKKPAIPPHIVAIKSLDKLKAKKLWQNGDIKEFYSELTDIIRIYMQGIYNFGAMEMISEEIIYNLQNIKIDAELLADAKKLFELADFAKFAKVKPLGDENDWALKFAYRFVETTKPKAEQDNKKEEVEL